MSAATRGRRTNPALGVFGLLCVAVSVLVLLGERDWAWLAGSWLGPTLLCGFGGIVLVATLWPARGAARPLEGGTNPVHRPPPDAAVAAASEPEDRPPAAKTP